MSCFQHVLPGLLPPVWPSRRVRAWGTSVWKRHLSESRKLQPGAAGSIQSDQVRGLLWLSCSAAAQVSLPGPLLCWSCLCLPSFSCQRPILQGKDGNRRALSYTSQWFVVDSCEIVPLFSYSVRKGLLRINESLLVFGTITLKLPELLIFFFFLFLWKHWLCSMNWNFKSLFPSNFVGNITP